MKSKSKKKSVAKNIGRPVHQREIYRDNIAGVQYSDYQLAKGIKAGDKLKLVWERTNRHDPNAIAVYHDNTRIGYIKKEHTRQLHQYREQKIDLHTSLVSYNPTNPTWYMFVIRITADDVFKPPIIIDSFSQFTCDFDNTIDFD